MRDSARFLFSFLCILGASSAPAAADFQSCLADLRGQAATAGVATAVFDTATRGLSPNDATSFLGNQPEFTTPIWDYLASLVDDERIADGRARLRAYPNALAQVEARFGVDGATVVAVWGVESDFGKSIGKRPLVQSLATLACSGTRRAGYFATELFATLKIIQNGDIDPAGLVGSWAGAFGHTQFMPSTFLRMAVDLDGDGHRDVVNSIPDALASTANYLRRSGWVTGGAWGYEVRLPAGYSGGSGRNAKKPMEHWRALGVTRADGQTLGEGAAGLLLPAGTAGPAFLVTRNFDAIYAYNAAESYALAISLLSDRLRGGGPLRTAWPTDDPGLARVEKRELQTLLARNGYDVGPPDGAIGDKTRAAIRDFQSRSGLPGDGRPGQRVLNTLRGR